MKDSMVKAQPDIKKYTPLCLRFRMASIFSLMVIIFGRFMVFFKT